MFCRFAGTSRVRPLLLRWVLRARRLNLKKVDLMRNLAHATLLTLALAAMFGALTACNTTAGAGKDLQQGGKALENSAEQHGAESGSTTNQSGTTDQDGTTEQKGTLR